MKGLRAKTQANSAPKLHVGALTNPNGRTICLDLTVVGLNEKYP